VKGKRGLYALAPTRVIFLCQPGRIQAHPPGEAKVFQRLFGKTHSDVASSSEILRRTADALNYSITKLRTGLSADLDKRYSPIYGDDAKYLCAAILNEALVEKPADKKAAKYTLAQRDLISTEVLRLHTLPETARALSYLYTAQILYLHLSNLSGNKTAASRIPELTGRATELSIAIPDTYKICGRGDAYSCAQVLVSFAEAYVGRVVR